MTTRILRHWELANEELVHGGDRPLSELTPGSDLNRFTSIFGGDPHAIRQYISMAMPGQDLELIGSGAYGMAFSWRRRPGMPADFFDGVVGSDYRGPGATVVKVTSQREEAKEAAKIIDASTSGRLPGIARYHWVKELPTIRGRKDATWLICLERVEPLTLRDRNVVDMLMSLESAMPGSYTERAADIEHMLSSDDMGPLAKLSRSYLASIGGRSGMGLLRRVAAGLDRIDRTAALVGISTQDLHHENLGWRGRELVAFDF